MKEWRDEITTISPQIQTGVIALSTHGGSFVTGQDLSALGDILDIVFPFVVLDNVTDDNIAGQLCNETEDIVSCKIVADIKLYGPYTNTDSDIVNAIESSINSRGNGFFLWCYDALDPEKYDMEKITDAYNGIYH
jgi:hypothetical protein